MEEWNTGRLVFKRILAISILSSTQILPLTQYCIMPEPIIPLFQHSTIPIGAKPLSSSLSRYEKRIL
jgi:hypothetical protein